MSETPASYNGVTRTPISQNSLDSWRKCQAEGLITREQVKVLQAFAAHGSMSARTASSIVIGAWKRVSELVTLGALVKVGDVQDTHTRRKVAVYRIPDPFPTVLRTPSPAAAKISRRERIYLEGAQRMAALLRNGFSEVTALEMMHGEFKSRD